MASLKYLLKFLADGCGRCAGEAAAHRWSGLTGSAAPPPLSYSAGNGGAGHGYWKPSAAGGAWCAARSGSSRRSVGRTPIKHDDVDSEQSKQSQSKKSKQPERSKQSKLSQHAKPWWEHAKQLEQSRQSAQPTQQSKQAQQRSKQRQPQYKSGHSPHAASSTRDSRQPRAVTCDGSAIEKPAHAAGAGLPGTATREPGQVITAACSCLPL